MKKSFLTLVASITLLGAASAAHAGTEVGQWTVGAGGLWTATDNQRGLDDGLSFNVSGGYAMSEAWDMSLNIFAGNHDITGAAGERTIKGAVLEFNRVFKRDERITPFVTLGAGIVDQFRPGFGVPEKEVVTKVGGGVLADVADFAGGKLQVKLDAGVRTSLGRQITDIVGGLGLQFAFGGGQ
jgi:hypothetical protein